ncbi:glycoside hydrolase family 88 protein [Paenibacillus agricola]|uniref:Uncharacterized protein n=1 Tax=Paenibacillus agricola TaxID=2716264 RepID=A0ABX0JLR9_9BACL|nr:glycoside hydrolase family 88 protein [Paenibacillus agricola]NHN35186.1 hypothetical protein [Paenibacillus agricola]
MGLVQYLPGQVVKASAAALPEGKSISRGWSAVYLGEAQDRMELKWQTNVEQFKQTAGLSSRLRITVALDYRDAQQVDVILLQSNERIGTIDIRYAYVFQPFEILLTAEQTAAALDRGVRLELKGGKQPLWVFDALGEAEERVFFTPHLVMGEPDSRVEEALNTMLSLHSLQPFGWMEGCVLDGLDSLKPLLGADRIDPILDLHFSQFFNDDGDLLYEDLHGHKADGTFTTIEATLPLAVITKYRPDHPVIHKAIQFFEAKGLKGGGAIMDEGVVSAEGSYTVAYPLAVMARHLGRRDMAEQAIAQVLLRRDFLARGQHVYLRYMQHSQEHTFRSWARAFSWYCLGLVKTCCELKDSPFASLAGVAELEAEITRIAQVTADWRQPSGLWSCFLDDAATGIDTSGSAGISAALALAASRHLLPASYMEIAKHNLLELSAYLTPDGILTGVAQHNAGGMELQRGGYRVCSQMGLGLWAQLYAYVNLACD